MSKHKIVIDNVIELFTGINRIIICPYCKKTQRMEYAFDSDVWFPVSPFCCDVMRFADSADWNNDLDNALKGTNG